jgi:hypothetical protein
MGRSRGKIFVHRLNKAAPSPERGDGEGGNPSPNDNFAMFFENVQSNKRDIYKQLKGKAGVRISEAFVWV